MALGALARLAEAIIYSDIDVTAKFEYLPGESFDIQVNPNSAMILQKSPVSLSKIRVQPTAEVVLGS